MYKFPTYWTDKLQIDFLQRVILIHSFLYYEADDSIWTDKQFDEVAKQLVELQSKHKEQWISNKTQYGYAFYDFDGTTGFHLWGRLNNLDRTKIFVIAMGLKNE